MLARQDAKALRQRRADKEARQAPLQAFLGGPSFTASAADPDRLGVEGVEDLQLLDPERVEQITSLQR